jgi:hypothetical protein
MLMDYTSVSLTNIRFLHIFSSARATLSHIILGGLPNQTQSNPPRRILEMISTAISSGHEPSGGISTSMAGSTSWQALS